MVVSATSVMGGLNMNVVSPVCCTHESVKEAESTTPS